MNIGTLSPSIDFKFYNNSNNIFLTEKWWVKFSSINKMEKNNDEPENSAKAHRNMKKSKILFNIIKIYSKKNNESMLLKSNSLQRGYTETHIEVEEEIVNIPEENMHEKNEQIKIKIRQLSLKESKK